MKGGQLMMPVKKIAAKTNSKGQQTIIRKLVNNECNHISH